jgi:hypothetical protein
VAERGGESVCDGADYVELSPTGVAMESLARAFAREPLEALLVGFVARWPIRVTGFSAARVSIDRLCSALARP